MPGESNAVEPLCWISTCLEQQYENMALNVYVLLGMEGVTPLPLEEIIVIRNTAIIKVKMQPEAQCCDLSAPNVMTLEVQKY